MKVVSHLISWLFLPLFMPVYGLLLAMYVPSEQDYFFNEESVYYLPQAAKLAILYMFFIFSILAPALSFLILHRRKIITTIDMENQRERNIPMFIMLAYCFVLYLLFVFKAQDGVLPKYIYALPLAGVLVTGSYTYINRWIKISLHAGGAGIFTGFLMAYASQQAEHQFWILPMAVILSAAIISARLFLGKHRPIEVYTGWGIATLVTFLVNFYYPI